MLFSKRQFMRSKFASFFVLCFTSVFALAQDVPSRFANVAKGTPFKLLRVFGSPEMHPAFGPTSAFSADGKRAVYVEDLTTGADDKPSFRARVYVWDVEKKGWPREIEIDGKNVIALS